MNKNNFRNYAILYFMLLPGIIFFIIFSYIPMFGIMIAFKKYSLTKGILGSPWVGLEHFRTLFGSDYFITVLKNTLTISLMKLFFGFPVPILFAVLLNEIRQVRFKRIVQTVSYLPYFVSWIALAGILQSFLSLDGTVNYILDLLGFEKVIFMADSTIFRGVLVVSDIWKNFGWGAVIYFAAMAGIDKDLYEAADIDGANRIQRIRHITIPSITYIIVIMLILSMTGILDAGFDQVFNLYNSSVIDVAEILDTYLYKQGIQQMQYSMAAAVGLFKAIVALVLILLTNRIAKGIDKGQSSLW